MATVIEKLAKCSKALEEVGLVRSELVCVSVYSFGHCGIQVNGEGLRRVCDHFGLSAKLCPETTDHFAVEHGGIRWVAIVDKYEESAMHARFSGLDESTEPGVASMREGP